MSPDELKTQLQRAACQVVGWEEAAHDEHRRVLGALAFAFDEPDVTILCEPSLAQSSHRPPDVVLIHPRLGVHVIELKAVFLDQVKGVKPGGELTLAYQNGETRAMPFAQVMKAMFDIKGATKSVLKRDPRVPFQYWVIFSSIRRSEWLAQWGDEVWMPPHLLFAENLGLSDLTECLTSAGEQAVKAHGVDACPPVDLQAVYRAFGDTAALMPPEVREAREAPPETLGARLDREAAAYQALSPEQERLTKLGWGGGSGPRLIRGVAGSGKSVVLATHVARRLGQAQNAATLLNPDPPLPRVAVVCHNRTLVPMLRQRIDAAYRQRTGSDKGLPDESVTISHLHGLVKLLAEAGLWRKRRWIEGAEMAMFKGYLRDLEQFKKAEPDMVESAMFDAVYVDEAQDLGEEEMRLLAAICRKGGSPEGEGPEPDLYIFYDDAQNLYGRQRPNWSELGLNLVGGRSTIMTRCFRTPRPIVEPAFNVLYGSFARDPEGVPTRGYGDLLTLEQKGLIERVPLEGVGGDGSGYGWRVMFAPREGEPPRLTRVATAGAEEAEVVDRVRWLVEEQSVRPEDVLVLAMRKPRVSELAEALEKAGLPRVVGVHVATKDRDLPLHPRDHITVSTIASAKGYDAACVLLASVNQSPADLLGRTSFYVAATRARHHLEVFAHGPSPLMDEMERAVAACGVEPASG